ncbi:signal protein PDZ [Nesterenkonia sp. MY13]|uniref:Signal protein PDZ n=1 Tax=Nesterenkonia sedimenti TaxID=1463632 RepID=A0A7X8TID8_9MICC|nr:S16 family serine protease [Nesterenkonia sedimenti]NLS09269.1 signal protein PDZ [Nesterenkonia sedimenti]
MTLRTTVQAASGIGAVALGVTALFLPGAHVIESPGPIFDTIGEVEGMPVITVQGADTYATEGTLALTTAYVSGGPVTDVRVARVIGGWLAPSQDVVPEPYVYSPGTTSEEVAERNTSTMASSQQISVAAALEHLEVDFDAQLVVVGFTERGVEEGVEEKLQLGDEITAAAGEPISGIEGLRQAVNEAEGEPIELTVVRDEEELNIEVPTFQEADGEYYVGIGADSRLNFPVDVDFRLEDVGGPSAGLMFTLGLIDTMTEESLTGGEHWAGTGTVDPDGTVGIIGGPAQKAVGANEAGADHFLVPRVNCDELEGRIPGDLAVYGVDDVDEAVAVIEAVRDGDTEYLDSVEPCGR